MTSPIYVLGAGVVGLSTASTLMSKYHAVTIIAAASAAAESPVQTQAIEASYASPKAGAHWRPYATNEDHQLQKFEKDTFMTLVDIARSYPDAGVVFPVAGVEVWERKPDVWVDPWYREFVPHYEVIPTDELPSGTEWGIRYSTICIDTPKYTSWLTKSFLAMGGRIIHRTLTHIDDVVDGLGTAAPSVVVNCLGLGSRDLGGVEDKTVIPVRGQTVLVHAPSVSATVTKVKGFTYVIPRFDGTVILGGTYAATPTGPLDCIPDAAITDSIVTRCKSLMPKELADIRVIKANVGYRPAREGGVRIEAEWRSSKGGKKFLVVHNYGHGGFGYQSSWATAARAAKLVATSSSKL